MKYILIFILLVGCKQKEKACVTHNGDRPDTPIVSINYRGDLTEAMQDSINATFVRGGGLVHFPPPDSTDDSVVDNSGAMQAAVDAAAKHQGSNRPFRARRDAHLVIDTNDVRWPFVDGRLIGVENGYDNVGTHFGADTLPFPYVEIMLNQRDSFWLHTKKGFDSGGLHIHGDTLNMIRYFIYETDSLYRVIDKLNDIIREYKSIYQVRPV